ncbi:MAG TPA: SpoIIE family protein phosphatase [Balneolaceae bacterium]|nr:SpoIIE family protein phosphatase [Balneolaceae bacterium]
MKLTIREYIFFVLSLLAGLYFFMAYPSQDPRSVIDLQMDGASIEQKAISRLESLGYSAPQFHIETNFRANNDLLDSLQAAMERPKMIDYFKQHEVPNIRPYYWEVTFRKKEDDKTKVLISASSEEEHPVNSGIAAIKLRFSADGEFLSLLNPDNILPLKTVNRVAMAAAFSVPRDSAVAVLAEFNDSTLTKQLFINIGQNEPLRNQKERLQRLQILLREGRHYMLSGQDVLKMASWYLEETGWKLTEFEADTVFMGRINGKSFASAHFKLTEPKLGQELGLNVRILPTGGLLGLSSLYNPDGNEESLFHELWSLIRNAIIFLFCVAGVILFFFRIRARAVDTKPSLVVAVIAGMAISLTVVLDGLSGVALWQADSGTIITFVLIGAGMLGAGVCLLFFAFFAIGDSITRQYWPQKLKTYDYLRQGMLFNRPVGLMLIRSVVLAFILAGFWTLLLSLFPNLYIGFENVFLSQKSLWPPLYLLISTFLTSLSIVLGIFLVLGGQVYGWTQNKIITSAVIVLGFVLVPLTGSFGPLMYELIIAALLGLILTLIYLQWDFLTLLISHFLFLGLLATSTAWTIGGSLDTYIFGSFLLLIVFFIVSGVLAVARGEKEQRLSHFVPEYVEELAQEERIKQELQIAREVQQSFLPERTPDLPRLELSAICKPAYETGGDYYDFIPLDENRIAVTIGDVSGKGIQAAFYMTFVKGIIYSLCRETNSPAELLKKANRLFYDTAPRGTFISLVYGIIDLEKRSFHFARAGHNPILRINGQNGSVEELQPKGIGIGLTKDVSFDNNIEEIELKLSTDDVLILYTDGIVEALNENHVFYGTHRLNNLLMKHKEQSAKVILSEVTGDVLTYIGKARQHDDMTMMVMKLKG